jgi:hypothetical protein
MQALYFNQATCLLKYVFYPAPILFFKINVSHKNNLPAPRGSTAPPPGGGAPHSLGTSGFYIYDKFFEFEVLPLALRCPALFIDSRRPCLRVYDAL